MFDHDEGDPGAYMNRNEIESDPHSLIEGMLIAAWAVDAEAIYIYLRDEYPAINEILREAIADLDAADEVTHLQVGSSAPLPSSPCRALLRRCDEVLVFEPCYTNYLSFAAQADVTMVPVTLEVGDGYHFGSIDRLRAAIVQTAERLLP